MILVSAWRWGLLLGRRASACVRPPDLIVSGRHLLQQFPAEQYRRRRRPDCRHRAGRRLQDAGHDGRPDRPRARAAGPGAGRGARRLRRHWVRPGWARSGPACLWAGFGVAAMLATPALLMPEGFTRLLQPLRILHPEWVDERLGAADDGAVTVPGVAGAPWRLLRRARSAVQAVLVAFYLAIAHSLQIPDHVRAAGASSCRSPSSSRCCRCR